MKGNEIDSQIVGVFWLPYSENASTVHYATDSATDIWMDTRVCVCACECVHVSAHTRVYK